MIDPAALAVCRASLARHSRSFSLAARLLPAALRDPVAVVYAWCRRCDDAIDEVPRAEQSAALERLLAEVEAVYAGAPMSEPVLVAFQQVVRRYGIPRVYVNELLAGLAMDARGAAYRDLPELMRYCYRVAGTVGLMICHVVGIQDPRLLARAAHLGMAMQLTNICRDVAEDWARGRRYVPAALLEAPHAPRGEEPFPSALAPAFAQPTRQLLEHAARYYESADVGLRALGFRAATAIRLARYVYAAIGDEVARRGYDASLGRAVVGTGRKLLLLGRCLGVALLDLPRHLRQRGKLGPPKQIVRFEDALLVA